MTLLWVQRVFNVYDPNADPPEPKVLGGEILIRFDGPDRIEDYDPLVHTLVVQAVIVNWANCDRPIEMEMEAGDNNGELKVSIKGDEKGLDEEIEVEGEGTVTVLRLIDDESGQPFYHVPNLKIPGKILRSSKEENPGSVAARTNNA